MTQFTVYCMDVLDGLKRIEQESVDCVITSPPYWGLRDYGTGMWKGGHSNCKHKPNNKVGYNAQVGNTKRGIGRQPFRDICGKCGAIREDLQIGLEPHPKQWIQKMVKVSRGLRRVLKPSGSFWLNVGDTYFGGCGGCKGDKGDEHDQKLTQSWRNKAKNYGSSLWLTQKQKLLMPHRLAIALQDNGWIIRNDVCWYKPSHMPSSVKDRLCNSFEFVFHFVKSNKPNYFVNQQTKECVDKRTSRDKEGIDWHWINHRACRGKGCNNKRCVNGKIKESFWRGIDYFYDLDAIREPHSAIDRPPGNKNKDRESKLFSRNPTAQQAFNPSGKNPGDAWQPYDTKYEKDKYGQSLQGFIRNQTIEEARRNSRIEAKQMFPDNPKRQQEYINFIHDHLTHPLGRNPGDSWEISSAKMRKGWASNPGHPFTHERKWKKGADGSDYWVINPKPYPEAHFACFPPALVERPLKATCPKQVCVKCGKPRERIIKGHSAWKMNIRVRDVSKGRIKSHMHRATEEEVKNYKEETVKPTRKTVGWSKCSCNAGFRPGVVLDPFVGSGTTLMVAKEMGLRGIGIELNPDYIKLIRRRLFGDAKPENIGKGIFEVITK